MIMKKVRPSRSSTSTEVFKFWLKFGMHEIPKEHHYNMLMGIGCKDRTLKRFINAHHSFNELSVVDAIIDSNKQKKSILNKDFLVQHFADNLRYGIDVQNEILKIKGIDWMLKNDFCLDKHVVRNYLRSASNTLLKSLIPHVECLRKAEKEVFECGYAPLVIAYLKTVKNVEESNVAQLLIFDDVEVYRTFFDEHSYKASNEFITKILEDKSDEIVKELATFVRLNAESEILLIKRGNFSLLKAQLDNFGNTLCKESIDYLSLNADDEMFKSFIKHPDLDISDGNYPDSFFERLFKLGDKEILKNYIRSSYLPSKFEEELLKLNDKELIKEYFGENKQCFTNKTAVHILKNGTKEQVDELLDGDYSIGFYGEAWLFKSGLDNYIQRYLKDSSLSGFGEACLVKFAKKEIVEQYLNDDVVIGDLSFVAAMERKDEDIIKRFVELKPYFYGDERDFEAFMLYAPYAVIAHFFENLEESEYMNTEFEISVDAASKIFRTREKEVQELFVHWFDIVGDEDLANCLVEFADKEIVLEKLNDVSFSFNTELLLKRGDKDLIEAYLEDNELMDGDEEKLLLQTLDEDLILKYHEDYGFGCVEDNILNE